MAKKHLSNAKLITLIAVALAAVFVAAVGFVQRQAIYDQLYAWKLVPHPERLTELYFTDHTNLPKTYSVGEKRPVEFTVRNLEHRDTEYTYTITVAGENGENPKTINGMPFTLSHEQSKDINQELTPHDTGQRSKVTVTLSFMGIELGEFEPSQQTQSIHYWVEREEI